MIVRRSLTLPAGPYSIYAREKSSACARRPRRALIGEGISEVILLPTLFREATGEGKIDFQVVAPGISNVRAEDIEELDASAARLVYLVDGDEGGELHRQRLLDAGVPSKRILVLGGGKEELAVEDLVVRDLYLTAVNRELEHLGVQISDSDIPKIGRKRAMEQWCKTKKIDKPSEREVAQQLLRLAHEARARGESVTLLDPGRAALMRALHKKVLALLQPSKGG